MEHEVIKKLVNAAILTNDDPIEWVLKSWGLTDEEVKFALSFATERKLYVDIDDSFYD